MKNDKYFDSGKITQYNEIKEIKTKKKVLKKEYKMNKNTSDY